MTAEPHDSDENNILQATRDFVRQYMSQYDSSHDWSHIQRVVHLAEQIADMEQVNNDTKYDMNTVKLAALLHDVGDAKYAQPQDPEDPVRRFLVSVGATTEMAEKVQAIVDRVSFSKEAKDPQGVQSTLRAYPELAVVQDADRLDALGAVGVGRCFTYNASRAQQQSPSESHVDDELSSNDAEIASSMEDAMAHFEDKLVRLETMMKTTTGRRIAKKRTERLSLFQQWWQEEQAEVI